MTAHVHAFRFCFKYIWKCWKLQLFLLKTSEKHSEIQPVEIDPDVAWEMANA